VLKKHNIPIEFDDVIFSIVTKTRTLDLQAGNSETRNRWVKFLKLVLSERDKEKKVKSQMDIEVFKEFKERRMGDLENVTRSLFYISIDLGECDLTQLRIPLGLQSPLPLEAPDRN